MKTLPILFLTVWQQVRYMMQETGLFRKLIRFLCIRFKIGRAHFFAPYKQIGRFEDWYSPV